MPSPSKPGHCSKPRWDREDPSSVTQSPIPGPIRIPRPRSPQGVRALLRPSPCLLLGPRSCTRTRTERVCATKRVCTPLEEVLEVHLRTASTWGEGCRGGCRVRVGRAVSTGQIIGPLPRVATPLAECSTSAVRPYHPPIQPSRPQSTDAGRGISAPGMGGRGAPNDFLWGDTMHC